MNQGLVSVLAVLTLTLAGCGAPEDGSSQTQKKDIGDLAAGTGAIQCLLVDDRFRPLDLEDDPRSEFQFQGVVLLQELAIEAQTNENGECYFTDLDPGQYTLRVSMDGHEVVPRKVDVIAGFFAEIDLLAQRHATDDEVIIHEAYSYFIPCAAYAIFDCTGDMSGDSYRSGLDFRNFTKYGNTTWLLWEVLMNNGGIYCLEFRHDPFPTGGSEPHWGQWCTEQDGTYIRGILQAGEIYSDFHSQDPWDPTEPAHAPIFYFGNNELTCWTAVSQTINPENNGKRCVGVGLGIQGDVLLSIFLGELGVDIESYCVICEE